MTRGIIVYIGINGGFCVSTEFNGDMHSYSNGSEIIEKYKERKLITKSDYIKFVTGFDRRHYRYGDEEFEIIKTHAQKSSDIIDQVLFDIESKEFLTIAENIARYHHEWFDGSGYPCKLKGAEIPFEARIMAIADVFDALVSERCYKQPMSYEEAYSIIRDSMGTHFDPNLFDTFDKCFPKLVEYYKSEKNKQD